MIKILKDIIFNVAMPFFNDIGIKRLFTNYG